MPNKIKIDSVTGGGHKDDLKNCYFLPAATAGTYNFYDTNNNSLASNLTSGTDFSFNLDSHNWTITNFVISDSAASGDWTIPSITAEEDGTFQAQAGTGTDAEEASSAATS
jgi:hypothetical protein